MSEEIDKIEGICQDCIHLSKIMPIIEQLQQENEELKEQLKINNQAFNFNVKTIKKHNKENDILTEFEKWIEELIKKLNYNDFDKYAKGYLQMCKGKLQELKEGKK